MSSFDLWHDILETNSVEVSAALDAYIEKLTALRRDFEGEFRKAGEFARSLRARG
jgi:prephenate dehydrogenase